MTKQSKSLVRVAAAAQTQDTKARAKLASGDLTLDSFVNFQMRMGMGADNAMSGSTYGFNPITRNRILLEWIYRGSWIGGVAVDLVADDMTRAGVEFKTDLEPDDQDQLEEAATTLDIWNKLNESIRWGRLYGGALAVLLIDGQDPRTPLRMNTVGRGQFRGLAVFDRWMVEPELSDLVTEYGPDLGLPRYYRVMPSAPCLSGKVIHHSRIVMRQEGISLPYHQRLVENLWGLSVIERLYDRLVAFDSATTGSAQLVYKSYLRTLKVKSLREVVAQGGKALEGLTAYVQNMAKYQGIEGVTMIDAEDDYTSEHHGAFSGLSDTLVQFGQQLSGALQIPLVRMFGQSPAGLSATGESDIRNYYDNIKQAQVKQMKVGVTNIYRCIAASEGIAIPDNFRLDFKSLWQLSDTEKAEIASKIVTTITTAEEGGLISQQVAMKELRQSSDVTGIFTNITETDITAADNTIQPPGAEEALGGFGDLNEQTGPDGGAGQVPPGPQGGGQLQRQAPGSGPAGRQDSQGAGARRVLARPGSPGPGTGPVQRTAPAVGKVGGGADARRRIAP